MNINDVQRLILLIVDKWAHEKKTPIPQQVIMQTIGVTYPQSTVKAAVRVLVKKGYIRKSSEFTRGASYVQLRTIAAVY